MSIITKQADTPFFDTRFYTQPRYLIVQNLPLSFAINFSFQKMNLEYLMQLRQSSTERQRRWLQQRSLLANPLHCGGCNTNMTLVERSRDHVDGYQWYEWYILTPIKILITLFSQNEKRYQRAPNLWFKSILYALNLALIYYAQHIAYFTYAVCIRSHE